MGGICSVCVRNSAVDKSPSDTTLGANTIRDADLTNKNQPKLSSEYVETQFQEELVSSSALTPDSLSIPCNPNVSDELPRLSRSFSQNSALARQRTASTKAGTKACVCYFILNNYLFFVLDFLMQCSNLILRKCSLYFLHGSMVDGCK